MNANGFYEKSYNVQQPDGSIKRIRLRSKTKEGLDEKCYELEHKIDCGEIVVNKSSTFKRWMEEWIEVYKKPKVDSGYLREIEYILNKFFVPSIGKIPITQIKLSHIQRCLNEMEGYSQSYIHRAKVFITECFRKAEDLDIIYKSPCRGIEEPKAAEKQDRRPLTVKEINCFLKATKSHHRGAMFAMMLACGLRPGEVMAIRWEDIDLENNLINVRQAVRDNTKEIKSTKTKSGKRTVPIPQWYIDDYLPNIVKDDSLVFHNEKGLPIGSAKFAQAWHSLMRDMDIIAGAKLYRNRIIEHALPQDIVPYCLRHTYCTQLVEKQAPVKTVQYLMGHSDIRMTMEIYTHFTQSMVESARNYI